MRTLRAQMRKALIPAFLLLLGGAWQGIALVSSAVASHTPVPSSVTVAGSLQSELGCASDLDPTCAQTHLAYDASDDVWQGTFTLPAGSYEYKAALNNSWDENYGANAVQGGSNIPLNLAADPTSVKFYYDHKSHWITSNRNSIIAVAPGSFQSELGCAGDWDPGCLRSWLQDPAGNGIYTFTTTAIPPGSYEAKVAIDENWNENYGAGGVQDGPNIPFSVSPGAEVRLSYDAATHVLTITKSCPGGPPSLSVSVSPDTLFPANHQYVTVSATVNSSGTVDLLSVTSNEPDDAPGNADGKTVNDIVTVNDDTFLLRAERSKTGSGRIYTITYQGTDTCGGATTQSATVAVPVKS
jgi:Pullulanase X25 domain